MSKKWIAIYAMALVLLPVLFFVFIRFESPSEMLRPPKLNGESAQIQNAFELSIPNSSNVILKYPSQGEYRTPFVLYDVDGDNEKEAVVFYTLKTDETVVRINILDKLNGEWESVYDDIGYGSDIISISFKDLNHDKKPEILCFWSLFDSNSTKIMTVHTASNSVAKPVEFKTLANVQYSFVSDFDFDDDGDLELLVVWMDPSNKNQRNMASVLKVDENNTMVQLGKPVLLDSSVSSYANAYLNKSGKSKVVLLDAYKGENSMITEVLSWNEKEKRLDNISIDNESLSTTSTQRTPAVPCTDINGNGQMEIPTNNTPVLSNSNEVEMTTWLSVSGGELVPGSKSFINNLEDSGYFYSLFIPANFTDVVSATKTTSVLTVYGGEEPLFSVVGKKISDISDDDTHSFKVDYKEYTLYGTVTGAGEKFGIQDEVMQNGFIFIE